MTRLVLVLGLATALAACNGDDSTPGADASTGGPDADLSAPDAFAGPGCLPTYANCQDYEDLTGQNAVTINISGLVYTPKCIRVSAGTQVTIEASGLHPLRAASCSPEDFVAGPTTATATYTMSEEGVSGYFCTAHGSDSGSGQAGAIQVVP